MSTHSTPNPHLILPVGTQVVVRREVANPLGVPLCPAGAVGVVAAAPVDATHAYRVRLTDGTEVALRRGELGIHRRTQAEDLAGDADAIGAELKAHVVFRCVVGSRAYGLDGAHSDTDRRGVYLPPASLHWSLRGVPEQLELREAEECYWELQKFLGMALKANPNVLECLYSPLVEHAAPVAEEMLAERGRFLSRMLYRTYNGYVLSQFRRLEADFRTLGEPRWKHAMHLVRLLLSGVAALREGHVPVRVEEHRERLLSVKRGEMAWEEVNRWRLALHAEFDRALATTPLPERPDYAWADDYLIRARRSVVDR